MVVLFSGKYCSVRHWNCPEIQIENVIQSYKESAPSEPGEQDEPREPCTPARPREPSELRGP